MGIIIRKAVHSDIENISGMYDSLCDWLEDNGNGPGWKKGVYPTAKTAADAIYNGIMYIAVADGNIAGTVVLSHIPENFYSMCDWDSGSYEKILIIYTLAVSPAYMRKGVGKAMISFAKDLCIESRCHRLRLDVWEENKPAIEFYKKCGFEYRGTVEYENPLYGTDRRCMYEMILK